MFGQHDREEPRNTDHPAPAGLGRTEGELTPDLAGCLIDQDGAAELAQLEGLGAKRDQLARSQASVSSRVDEGSVAVVHEGRGEVVHLAGGEKVHLLRVALAGERDNVTRSLDDEPVDDCWANTCDVVRKVA